MTLVELCSHLATERAGMGTLHLTAGASELYPNKPSSSRLRNRRSQVGRITGNPGKSAEDETVAAGLAVAVKRGNARGAKEPYCTDVGVNGRQGWLDKPTHHAARPETPTVRYGEGCDSVATVE